jgi:poly(3-hydroxybutyrate) depolymerase/plastocyanin
MSEKIYIVTLYKHEDLEEFYVEMKEKGFRVNMKRPISRNTHYWMTDDQAQELKSDPRVWDVDLRPEDRGIFPEAYRTIEDKLTPYQMNGTFWKGDTQGAATIDTVNDKDWGKLHVAGTAGQRDKNVFGLISGGGTIEKKPDVADIFSDGRNVDVVICDDPVTRNCNEWSSNTHETRFVNYEWFNELNTIVGSIDDDSQTLPTGSVYYWDQTENLESHGTHVTGTVASKNYGWAPEANIYGCQILGTWPSSPGNGIAGGQNMPALLLFDYLRAFHRNKKINPVTGFKNPTITNHSWGYNIGTSLENAFEPAIQTSDILEINYRGVLYDSNNPNPSGWTMAGIESDFGIGSTKWKIPSNLTNVNADVQDAINDGIVVISAAGNSNFHIVSNTDIDYDNYVRFNGYNGTAAIYFNRGSSPASAEDCIMVGALDNSHQFKRSSYTNFGPRIDVFAPGNNILSVWGDPAVLTDGGGLVDGKWQGADWVWPIQGTSMASPQVAGVAALIAGARRTDRFSNNDLREYLNQTSIFDDMTFDTAGGTFSDNTCRKDSPNKYLHLTAPRPTSGYMSSKIGGRTREPLAGQRRYVGPVFPRTKKLHASRGFPSGILSGSSPSQQLEIIKEWRDSAGNPATAGMHQYVSDIYVPTNESPANGYPVMICLHGNGASGSVINNAPYNLLTDHIRVGPTGSFASWNIVDENSVAPDIQYLKELINLLKTFNNVDATKIRISGISNGAALACRAFVEIDDPAVDMIIPIVSQLHAKEWVSDKFYMPSDDYGVASTNTSTYGYDVEKVPATGRKLLMIQNTNDPTIPYSGGTGVGIQFLSAQDSTYYMAQALGFGGAADSTGETYQGDSTTQIFRYTINGNQNEVVHATSSTAGHGTNANLNSIFDEWVESNGTTITMAAPYNTYNISVSAVNSSNYILSGTDRNGSVSGNDPTVTVTAGDTINFSVGAPGHPFYIKTSYVGGSGSQVSTGTITGTQGTTNSTLSWNTSGVSAGTYYYVCSPHASFGMGGSIVVT